MGFSDTKVVNPPVPWCGLFDRNNHVPVDVRSGQQFQALQQRLSLIKVPTVLPEQADHFQQTCPTGFAAVFHIRRQFWTVRAVWLDGDTCQPGRLLDESSYAGNQIRIGVPTVWEVRQCLE